MVTGVVGHFRDLLRGGVCRTQECKCLDGDVSEVLIFAVRTGSHRLNSPTSNQSLAVMHTILRESTRNRLICSTMIVIVSYTRSDGFVSTSDVQLQPRDCRKWVIASGRLTTAEQWVGHGCGVARVPLSEAATFQCSSRTECVESLAASGHMLPSAACWKGMTGDVDL